MKNIGKTSKILNLKKCDVLFFLLLIIFFHTEVRSEKKSFVGCGTFFDVLRISKNESEIGENLDKLLSQNGNFITKVSDISFLSDRSKVISQKKWNKPFSVNTNITNIQRAHSDFLSKIVFLLPENSTPLINTKIYYF